METVLKPLVTRFAQPIILSFFIAWIFWNWQIVVGLIWYDNKTLPLYGYPNYRELIIENTNLRHNLYGPAFSALLYPFLRFILNLFNTFIRTHERKRLLTVSGTGNVSTLKYLQLRKSYDEKIEELSKYLREQTDLQTKVNETDTELLKTKSELIKAQEGLEECKHRELVRSDDVHGVQMQLQEANEKIETLEKELHFTQKESSGFMEMMGNESLKVHDYESKSNPIFISGNYTIKIYRLEKSNFRNLTNIKGSISQGAINFELHVAGLPIAEITSYYFNIINNTIAVFFRKNVQQHDTSLEYIMGFFHEFTIEENGKILRSKFQINSQHYTLDLEKR